MTTTTPVVPVWRDGRLYLRLHVLHREERGDGWVVLHGYVYHETGGLWGGSWCEPRSVYGRMLHGGRVEMVPSQ